jgi:hypothetical protein
VSNKNAPTDTNSVSVITTTSGFKVTHNGHPLTHVGQVVNPSLTNTQGLSPAIFDVWYCQLDHVLLIDNAS